MTGYQKLRKENQILWANLKMMIEAHYKDETNKQELVEKELAWIKWQIKNETNQEKN